MVKNIAICLNPFLSHFIPTISIYHSLNKLNYNVVFVGFSELETEVKRRGYDYISIKSCSNNDIILLEKQKNYKKLSTTYINMHEELKQKFEELQIDCVFIGISRFPLYLLPAVRIDAKVVLYSLCGGVPFFSLRCPPITSDFNYTFGFLNKFLCLLKWTRRFIRKGIVAPLRSKKKYDVYPWPELLEMSKNRHIKWRFGIDGFFPDYPVVVMGTKHIEFDEQIGVMYAGLCIHDEPSGDSSSNNYHFKNENNPLIYCSFGTLMDRYLNVDSFIKSLLILFEKTPQWNLLISLGNKRAKVDQKMNTDNVQVVSYVNQIQVLKSSSLVITHGGYSTVKECIYYEVPMIVLSCSYDQHGNAARVQRHKIGIKSTLLKKTLLQKYLKCGKRKISPRKIKALIEKVLCDEKFSTNIINFHNEIKNEPEMEKTLYHIFNEIYYS